MITNIRDTFHADHKKSWELHDRFCIHFFRKISKNGEFACIKYDPTGKQKTSGDDLVIALQKQGVDVATIDKQTGNTVFWDEKADTHFTSGNFCLEWWSNTDYNRRSPGWMQTSKAHWLLYYFVIDDNTVEAYALDNHELQKWFWNMHLKQRYHLHIMPDTINHTASYLVPIEHVIRNIKYYRCRITSDGKVERIYDNLTTEEAS